MNHPLIDRLVTELGYAHVSLANHEEFVSQSRHERAVFSRRSDDREGCD